MVDLRGLAESTVLCRCGEARHFLGWLAERASQEGLAGLTIADVDAYMKDRAGSLRRVTVKHVSNMLRNFLRWLHFSSLTSRDLSAAVIAPSIYAFENIPCALRVEDVQTVLAVIKEDSSPKGLRDYAVLQLLAIYGLRAGEITKLRLENIDWRNEAIQIRHHKTGAISYLPLLPKVGESLLRYLQKGRPTTHFREVFLRSHAPSRPYQKSSSLHALVRHRLEAAGVSSPGKRGPHAFRHTRAVSLLRATVPMKTIGDLLGHRSTDSTCHSNLVI